MNIKDWFANNGTFEEGVKLYSQLKSCNAIILRAFNRESSSTFLKLKYELKKASYTEDVSIEQTTLEPFLKTEIPKPLTPKTEISIDFKKELIQQSSSVSFQKETMAQYPKELHSTYRQRINDFYLACELKFELNSLDDNDEDVALKIILQLDDLWTRIDRAWNILNHWKDFNRIMPTEESEDFTKLNGIQLVKTRDQLQSRISKREKTLLSMELEMQNSPENRGLVSLYNRKLEQLEQLKIDLETVRKILKDE